MVNCDICIKFLVIVIILIGLQSCWSLLGMDNVRKNDAKLTLKLTPFFSNKLRIDGFYYSGQQNNYTDNITFLYKNGVIVNYGSFASYNFNTIEEQLQSENFVAKIKSIKYGWGVFLIDGNIIKYEQWYASNGGPYPTFVREGKILNDTSYHIHEAYKLVNGNKTEITNLNETYYFRKYSPKPDSANEFIK